MRRESIRTIGMVLVFAVIAVVIIFHDEISALLGNMMMGQTDSMLEQLLR